MKKQKMPNIEALRCLAMMMVVVLHYLGKGKLLGNSYAPDMGSVGIVAWLLESFCIVAVNVYMLISGYFLCASSFKIKRLLMLYIQLWMYSDIIGMIACLTNLVPENDRTAYNFFQMIFPVSMEHYWFMTAYFFLYLLLPILQKAVTVLSKKQFQCVLVMMLIMFSGVKSVIPVDFSSDRDGYDCIWYICMFMVAAYIRRFGAGILEKTYRAWLCYFAGVMLIFAGIMGVHLIFVKTGRLQSSLDVFIDYNHLFVVLASVGLFLGVLKCKHPKSDGIVGKCICKIAPYSLGVYLLHENLGIRQLWPKWLGAGNVDSVASLIGHTLLAVVCVFTAGIVVEAIRSLLMSVLHRILLKAPTYAKLMTNLDKIDGFFAKNAPT